MASETPAHRYLIRLEILTIYCGQPLAKFDVPITEEDLKLGIPARVYGAVNKRLADGLEQVALIERRKRDAPETVDLQESQ
jgi:hypothetical protein